MNEYKVPFPIIIYILEGTIDLGVDGEMQQMNSGEVITLDANIPYNLKANENAIIRLTLSKLDKYELVKCC